MNILVVGQYFYPDNFRINEIAQELVKRGHQVTVLTGLPDYATGRVPKEYRRGRRRRETVEGVEVIRVPIIARRTGVLWRALNYLSFLISSSLYVSFHKLDCDVVFCYQTSPVSMAQAAVKAKKKTGKKLVLYCLDIWPECLKAWRVAESSPLFKAVHRYSRYIYGRCDTIAISSKPFREYLTQVNGVRDEKIVYLPQHAEDLYSDIAGQYVDNKSVDFLFAGNVGSVQNVDCILKAAARIDPKRAFHIHIVGDGSELENCRRLSRDLKIDSKVTFHGRYPLEEMQKFYLMADCFLLTLRGGDFIGKTLPAKSQGYLCAGKPVVAAIDGAAFELISEVDCGIAVPAGDDKLLAQAMENIIDNPKRAREQGENGRKYFETYFTKDKFLNGLLQLIK